MFKQKNSFSFKFVSTPSIPFFTFICLTWDIMEVQKNTDHVPYLALHTCDVVDIVNEKLTTYFLKQHHSNVVLKWKRPSEHKVLRPIRTTKYESLKGIR